MKTTMNEEDRTKSVKDGASELLANYTAGEVTASCLKLMLEHAVCADEVKAAAGPSRKR